MKVYQCLSKEGLLMPVKVSDGVWAEMHSLRKDCISKATVDVLKKFNQPLTIFNTSVMEKFGYIPLTAHYYELAKKLTCDAMVIQ
jgi:hypothetical protein